MDNRDNLIFLALAWLLSIPTGILINLVTPSIDTYLKNRSLSAKERKIKIVLIRYINIKNLKEHPVFIDKTPVFLWLPFVSVGLIFLILTLFPNFSWFRVIIEIIASIPMYYSIILMNKDMANRLDFFFFDRFKRRTIKKLKKLGCNPRGKTAVKSGQKP